MTTAVDNHAGFSDAANLPAMNAAAVTTSDTVDLANVTKAIYVGVSGDVAVIMANGQTVTLKAAPVGYLAIRIRRVKATGTTATNIVALW
jgi:hypothetical protein